MGSHLSASVGSKVRSGRPPKMNSSGPTRNVTGAPGSFHERAPPRRLTPLPLAMSRAFTFARGALSTIG